jgi:AraC-like DNA-binding protein
MMLALIAQWNGMPVAAAVTDALIHHRMRERGERQRMALSARLGVSNPKLLQAVALMEEKLEAPLACSEIAEAIQLSPRQMERLFRDHLGEKPACRSSTSPSPAASPPPRTSPRPTPTTSASRRRRTAIRASGPVPPRDGRKIK